MNERHFPLTRPRWDDKEDVWTVECSCGKQYVGDTAEDAMNEYDIHERDEL